MVLQPHTNRWHDVQLLLPGKAPKMSNWKHQWMSNTMAALIQ
eukprot:COSAG02_NODE_1026_length_15134_cov_382.979714_13_plen_42_part_00